jgi:hypothetical protein
MKKQGSAEKLRNDASRIGPGTGDAAGSCSLSSSEEERARERRGRIQAVPPYACSGG